MKSISPTLFILFILFLGLIARLYDLDGESIWTDEGHTLVISDHDISKLIEENSRDNHPPLYSIILHFWTNFVPKTAFYLRLLSCIFGVLAIYLIYKVGEAIVDNKTGLLSALIFSLSVFHIHFSQELRSYTLVVVLVLLSFFLFIKQCRKPKVLYTVWYILTSVLLVYTHFLGWFIILAQTIIYAVRLPFNRNRLKYIIIVDTIILILYLPWIKIMISRISSMQNEFWVELPNWLSIPQTFLIFSGTYTFYGICLLLVFSFLFLFSFIEYKDRTFKYRYVGNEQNYLLQIWLWIPILIPFVLSFVLVPVFISRITIGASLAFYIISAVGLKNISSKTIQIVILVTIVVFSLGNLGIYYKETNKEQWREATKFIEENAVSGDLILFHAGFGLDKAFDFYAKRDDLVKRPFPQVGLEVNEKNIKNLNLLTVNYNTVWIVLSHSRDKNNLIIKNIEQHFTLVLHKEYVSFGINSHRPYVGIEIFQYRR